MGQPEGPATPEDKRANFYWADLGFLNYKVPNLKGGTRAQARQHRLVAQGT